MSDTTAETLKRFAKFRDLAGGDPVAGALLVLACAISEPKGLDEPASLLGIDDVAKRLGVSTGTIRGLIKNGLLPASRVGSGARDAEGRPGGASAIPKAERGGELARMTPPRSNGMPRGQPDSVRHRVTLETIRQLAKPVHLRSTTGRKPKRGD